MIRSASRGFVFALFLASLASAQEGLRAPIDWRVLDAGEFQVHYPGEQFLPRAREVAQWLESARMLFEKDLDHKLDGPVGVLLYRSRLEAGQHFRATDNPEGLFPIATSVRKRRILIPCLGSNRDMQRTLEFQLAQIFIDQRHYTSDTLKASLLEVKSDLYADWVNLGVAAFKAGPVSPIEEMLVRDAVLDGELEVLSTLHSANNLNNHERYQMLVESALAVEWIEAHTPRGSAKRLMHVFDSDVPWPTGRLIQRACGISYTEVEERFAKAMKERYRPWAGREEVEKFARRLRGFEQHYRFYELGAAPSADGRKLAFFEDSSGYFDLVTLDLESGDEGHPLRIQLHVTIDSLHPGLRGVDWSPDGKFLCFVGDRLAETLIFIQPAEGGLARKVQLPFDDVVSPQWSPDGKSIVFAGLRNGSQDLYLMDVQTSDLRRLTSESWPESDPAWSPDSQSVAFTGETDGQTDLWRIDVPTGRLERLTTTPADESCPTFRPDGAAVTFAADPGGVINLYSLELAGGRVTRHTDVPGGALAPRWMPSSNEIVFTVYRHGRFTTWSTPPREAPAPADFADATRAEAARHYTLGSIEKFTVQPYETRIRFESILPTGAKLSDLLGYHTVDSGTDYKFRSGGFDFSFDVTYTNRLLRPDLFISIDTAMEQDSNGTEKKVGASAGISYPIDADTRAGLSAFAARHFKSSKAAGTDDTPPKYFEDGFNFGVTRKNVTKRRSNPVSGYSISLGATWWTPPLGSDIDRVNYSGEGRLYIELWHDHVLALRVAATHSTGPDRESLSLKDKVRSYDSGEPNGTDVAWANAEFRFPIWRDIDLAMPAQVLLLKDLRASVFVDVGVISNEENVMNMLAYPVREEWHYSAGFSLQFDTYLLERKYFPIIITLAKALDRTDEAPRGIKFEVTFDLAF
ncbi:MAG: BamA/TamA family outer membrane protein [Planctomycetota bacterium]